MTTSENTSFSHKQLAVKCFNTVWELLDKKNRTELESEEMVHLCHTSFWNWTQVEEHTQQNLSIGYWQLSRVYSEVGSGNQALKYAHRCLDISLEAELAPFYIAYAYEAIARAQIVLKEMKSAEESLHLTMQFTSKVAVADSKKLLLADIESLRSML